MKPNRVEINGHADYGVTLETHFEKSMVLGALYRKLMLKLDTTVDGSRERDSIQERINAIIPVINSVNSALVSRQESCEPYNLTPRDSECIAPFMFEEPGSSNRQHAMALEIIRIRSEAYQKEFFEEDGRPKDGLHMLGVEQLLEANR